MRDIKTPSQFLMSILELESIDECDQILIVRRYKDGGISFDTNTNSRMDAYCLGSMCAAFSQADIVKSTLEGS